jgi:hypothetical protein
MWPPNMHRLGPKISTIEMFQGFTCASFQFMPKMHSTAQIVAQLFSHRPITPWRTTSRNREQEWEVCAEMIANTDPAVRLEIPLPQFAGRVAGTGSISLSTLRSAKSGVQTKSGLPELEFEVAIDVLLNLGVIDIERDAKIIKTQWIVFV